MTESRLARLEDAADRLEAAARRFERALAGAPEEGNKGVIPRLDTVERKVTALWFLSPLLVAGGAAIGQLLSGFLGL
jgi:hypothetical protein